jgi:formamidopyrimidine-DNA glycosylase
MNWLRGRRIKNVSRVGKYSFLNLDRGLIEIHFRFDGQLIWFANSRQLLNRVNRGKDGTHTDIAFVSSGVLGIVDPRHLARVHAWQDETDCRPLKSLGVDALSPNLPARYYDKHLPNPSSL